MAPALSKVAAKRAGDTTLLSVLSSAAVLYWLYVTIYKRKEKALKTDVNFIVSELSKDDTKGKMQLNQDFAKSLKGILGIIIPGVWCPETGYMLLVAFSLFLRSACDIWMINNGTLVERSIISMDLDAFKHNISAFFKAMPSISMVNNLLKFGLHELKLRFRTRLSHYLYEQYLRGFTYYKMSNLDNRISNPDQVLTQDVIKFCDSVVDLYSNLCKPFLDLVIYIRKLATGVGRHAPSVMILYLMISGMLLTNIRRPVSRLTATEQKLEGEFRYVNSRLITNSEEVAFYMGNAREKKNIDFSFNRLVSHIRKYINFRFSINFIDNIVAKYFAICVGFCVVAVPYLKPNSVQANVPYDVRMQEYFVNGRMLVKLAEAIGRLVLAGRELTRLAGFTSRVQELITVLGDLNKGTYNRTMLQQTKKTVKGDLIPLLVPGAGTIMSCDNVIRFEHVPLVTPNGDVLVRELNFEVKSGMNVLVCGPNGCGKSSLFRILGELWPVFGGTVTKPSAGKLFYIPQRPYMTLGTLRDQVLYPDTVVDMTNKGISDEDLVVLLQKVQLTYILEREGGWDAIGDWMDVLSGGEKQRIAMARVFYHKPQFAILDECTSAVSVDVEDAMYQYCREACITLFTVSHRKSLWKHHEYYLHMDGRGSFEFKKIEEETEEFGS